MCTTQCTLPNSVLYLKVDCTVNFIVHCTLNYTLLKHQSGWLSWPKSYGTLLPVISRLLLSFFYFTMYCIFYFTLYTMHNTLQYHIMYIMHKDVRVVVLFSQKQYPPFQLFNLLYAILYTVLYTSFFTVVYTIQYTNVKVAIGNCIQFCVQYSVQYSIKYIVHFNV